MKTYNYEQVMKKASEKANLNAKEKLALKEHQESLENKNVASQESLENKNVASQEQKNSNLVVYAQNNAENQDASTIKKYDLLLEKSTSTADLTTTTDLKSENQIPHLKNAIDICNRLKKNSAEIKASKKEHWILTLIYEKLQKYLEKENPISYDAKDVMLKNEDAKAILKILQNVLNILEITDNSSQFEVIFDPFAGNDLLFSICQRKEEHILLKNDISSLILQLEEALEEKKNASFAKQQ